MLIAAQETEADLEHIKTIQHNSPLISPLNCSQCHSDSGWIS